jgi:hypothetical protein
MQRPSSEPGEPPTDQGSDPGKAPRPPGAEPMTTGS